MATFTESQITDLAVILGTNSDYLSQHLDFYASVITDSDKTKVLALMSQYDGFDNRYIAFTPTESNEGLNMNLSNAVGDVESKIAKLLQFEYDSASSGNGLIRC